MWDYYSHRHSHACLPWEQYYYDPYLLWLAQYAHYHYQYLCPVCSKPHSHCCCSQKNQVVLTQEVFVDASSTPKEVLIGGISDVKLSLEYFATAAATSLARITVNKSGTLTTWDQSAFTEDYQVKNDFVPVSPGSKITIEVTDAIARLRWCEILEY